jgi:copper transport protein
VYQDTGGEANGLAVPRHPRGLSPTGRLAAGVLLTLCMIVLAPARPASAHALLLASDPPNGATLATSPRIARLWFSEEIAANFRSVRLVDSTGTPVAGVSVATSAGNPRLLVAQLPPLAPGAYGLVWQALSAADGHPTSGVIVFAVGRAAAGALVAAGPGKSGTGGLDVLLRWLHVWLLAGLIGAIAVALLLRSGAEPGPVHGARRRLLGVAATCAALGAAAGGLELVEQARRVAPILPTGPDASALAAAGRLVTASRWGELWIAREVVLVALAAVVLGLRSGTGRRRTLPTAAGLLIVAAVGLEALGSHAAALDSGRTAAVVAIAVHTLAACLWLGGVAALAVVAWPPRSGGLAVVRANVGRFTTLALLSVGLVTATGLYSAGRQLDSAGSLVATPYGRTLLVKTALLLVLLGLGLANSGLPRSGLVRRLAGARGAAERLPSRRLLALEAGTGIVLLLAVGVLAETPPPRATPQPARPAGRTVSGLAADLVVTVTVTPDRPGVNGFTVLVSSSRRPPPAPIEDVALNLTAGGVTSPVPAQQLEPGRYFGTTAVDAPGPVRLTVVVQRSGAFVSIPVDWSVPATARQKSGTSPFVPVVDTLAIAILAVLLSAGGWWLTTRRRQARAAAPDAQPEPVAQGSPR